MFILCCTLARGVMWSCQIPHYLSKPDPSLLSHQPPLQSDKHVSMFTHISSATQEALDYNAGREIAWEISHFMDLFHVIVRNEKIDFNGWILSV